MTTMTTTPVRFVWLGAALLAMGCAQVTGAGDGGPIEQDAATGDAVSAADGAVGVSDASDTDALTTDAPRAEDAQRTDARADGTAPMPEGGTAEGGVPVDPPSCNGAPMRTLTSGTLVGESSEDIEREDSCGRSFGAWRYYRVVVPNGQRVHLAARGNDYRPRILVMDTCGDGPCGEQVYPGSIETRPPTEWTRDNTSGAPVEYRVAIGDVFGGTWDLETTIGPIPAPPANTVCTSATMVTGSATYMAQDLRLGGRVATPACVSPERAPVLYYRIAVPSRGDLSVVTRAQGGWPLTVAIAPDCAASSACARFEVAGSFTHHNSGLRSQTYVVAVSSNDPDRVGNFDITLTASTEVTGSYAESTTPAACEAATGWNTFEGLTGTFDQASSTAELPARFAFALFGQPATHYAVHSNGLLQLFPDATGRARVTSFGGRLGDASEPNGVVAPLWMNIAPGPHARTSWQLLGDAPRRRLVIDWSGWEFWEPMTSAVRYQVKLFETTGVVEFHYCTLESTDDRATGSHATIGLESFAATAVAVHSNSASGPLSVRTALRFTPR